MRVLITDIGDEAAARRTAVDLLGDALVMRESVEPGGDSAIAYRAEWIGSPLALGAFGVHRDAEVTPGDLAAVLRGRHVREREQVYVTNAEEPVLHANFVLEIPAPEAMALEYPGASPERRAELERAVLATAEVALEDARRTVPVVENSETTIVAAGISAAAIVRAPDANGGLRVEAVVLGAEWGDGLIGAPSPGTVDELEQAAAGAGVERAARLAAAAAPAREAPTARWVGRGDAWVRDPLDEVAEILGESTAAALAAGTPGWRDRFAEADDQELDRQLAESGEPFAEFDPELAADREAEDAWERADRRRMRATEEQLMFKGRVTASGPSLQGKINAISTEAALEARMQHVDRDYEQASELRRHRPRRGLVDVQLAGCDAMDRGHA